MTDDDLKKRLRAWTVPAPDSGLADRIVMNALRHPQKMPWSLRLGKTLETWLLDWNAGAIYKCASLAMIVVIGLSIGYSSPYAGGADTISIVDLAMGGMNEWEGS